MISDCVSLTYFDGRFWEVCVTVVFVRKVQFAVSIVVSVVHCS